MRVNKSKLPKDLILLRGKVSFDERRHARICSVITNALQGFSLEDLCHACNFLGKDDFESCGEEAYAKRLVGNTINFVEDNSPFAKILKKE